MITDQINGNNFLRYSLIMSEIPGGLSMSRLTGDGSESIKWGEKRKLSAQRDRSEKQLPLLTSKSWPWP